MPDYDQQAATPYRTTNVRFDISESVLVDEAWGGVRKGGEVSQYAAVGQAHKDNWRNMKHWASGAWTLEPIQQRISLIHEILTFQSLIISLAGFRVSSNSQLEEVNLWRQSTDVNGVTYDSIVAATGDPWLVRNVAAGGSWDPTFTSGVPSPPFTSGATGGIEITAPLDRQGESLQVYPPDQGFFLRWTHPGTQMHAPDYTWTFYFGQFCVAIRGDGICEIWEYCRDASNVYNWRHRSDFRYCRAGMIAATSHTLMIWPHTSPTGERLIAFSGNLLEGTDYTGFDQADTRQLNSQEFIYKADSPVRGTDKYDAADGYVTIANLARFDLRRDLKMRLQISLLGFQQSGTLTDTPWAMPPFRASEPNLVLRPMKVEPAGSSITSALYDGDHIGTPFSLAAGHYKPYAEFTFASDGTSTPILWGYRLTRDEKDDIAAPGEFTGGNFRGLALIGSAGDITTESAQLSISDPTDALSKLRTRGQFPVSIEVTESLPNVAPKTVKLLRGYVIRPRAKRRGRAGADGVSPIPSGGAAAGPPANFPSPEWRDYDLDVKGQWARLSKRLSGPVLKFYGVDPNAAKDPKTGNPPPWKVTDVAVDVLKKAGYPPSMIAIPNLPIRLWPGIDGQVEDWKLEAKTDYGEWLTALLRNYLGAFLAFDPNASTDGQWILIFGTQPGAAPLWKFTRTPSGSGPGHLPASYPAGTSPIFELSESYVVPPEFNMVEVYGYFGDLGKSASKLYNIMYNFKSFDVPGFAPTADPTHPDYLAQYLPCPVIDLSLTSKDPAIGQQAVDWTCRRLFDFICHAQKIQPFIAPLVFILDPVTVQYRPLRYQDPIQIQGVDYLIRNVTPRYESDFHQLAEYEAIEPKAT